jgi:outer membrane protein TolC
MKKHKVSFFRFLSIVVLLVFTQQLYAQDSTVVLQLNDLIAQATTNNKNIQLAKMDEQIAASNYKQTEAMFLPQVGLSYSAFTTNNSLNAFGFKLQQKSISQADFNPALLNNPSATADFMTQLNVQQPIVNMDMLYMRKSALKQTELYRYKTQRTKENIIYQSQQAYLQLQMAYDVQKVLQESLETTKALYKFTNDRYEQGLLQKSDLLNVEVQIKTIETNLADVKSNIKNASDYISLLMNKPTGVVYSVDAPISIDTKFFADSLSANRSDFKAMEKAIESYNLAIKSSKMSYLPKLNAFANYQFHDKSMLGFGAGAYMAGIQLSWDIFKGNSTKNKIATQTLERNKMAEQLNNQKEESRVELNKTYRGFTDAAFKIQQQQASINQATEALQILQNRYQQGLVNTTDVLMAQTQLSQQKLGYAQAVFSKNVSLAYLQFLTSVNQ